MTRILAIDPGSQQSAWLILDRDGRPEEFRKEPNEQLRCRLGTVLADLVVIEWMSPRGMPTSAQEMEAMWWAGRFAEAAQHLIEVHRLTRDHVKFHLTGRRSKVNDANVRAALIDIYGGIGGKEAAIGRKAAKGPLYGIADDVWAALAVAVAWREGAR